MISTTIVASIALTAVLPLSVMVLHAILVKHEQLSPSSDMDSAAVERFNSEAEREAFHAALERAQTARNQALLARYRQMMDGKLRGLDPRRAAAFRRALEATTEITLETAPVIAPDVAPYCSRITLAQEAPATVTPQPGQQEPTESPARAHISRWLTHRGALRSNGSPG